MIFKNIFLCITKKRVKSVRKIQKLGLRMTGTGIQVETAESHQTLTREKKLVRNTNTKDNKQRTTCRLMKFTVFGVAGTRAG